MNTTKPLISLIDKLKHKNLVNKTDTQKLDKAIDSIKEIREILKNISNKPGIPPDLAENLENMITSLETDATDKRYYHA